MEFFPAKKQTEEYLKSTFMEKDLSEVVKLHKAQASYEAKRELTQVFRLFLNNNMNKKWKRMDKIKITFPLKYKKLHVSTLKSVLKVLCLMNVLKQL